MPFHWVFSNFFYVLVSVTTDHIDITWTFGPGFLQTPRHEVKGPRYLVQRGPEDGLVNQAKADNLPESLLVGVEGLPVGTCPAVQLVEYDGEAEMTEPPT